MVARPLVDAAVPRILRASATGEPHDMLTALLVLIVLAVLGLHHAAVRAVYGWRHTAILVAAVQGVFVIGTLVQVRPGAPLHWRYVTIVMTASCLLLATSILLALTDASTASPRRGHRAARPSWHLPTTTWPVWAVFVVSLTVVVVYYRAVGYVPLVEAARSTFGPSSVDVAGLRLASYSGDQYLAPGYVNQFRNVLLPMSTTVLAVDLVVRRSRWRWPFLALAAPAAILSLLGTGQRTAFILTSLVVVLVLVASPLQVSRGSRLLLPVVGGCLLVMVTYVLGRRAGSNWSLTVVLEQIATRVLLVNQKAGIIGFEYLADRPTQFGADWIQSLTGLLPGQGGSRLASDIFASRYGSSRGTSPPSMWASVHYNFGWLGVVGIPVALAWAVHALDRRLRWSGRGNLVEFAGLAGTAVVVATWVSNGPIYLLNSGILAYAVLVLLGRTLWGIDEVTAPDPARPEERRPVRRTHPVPSPPSAT